MKGLLKRGDVYYLRKMIDGRRVLRSLGTTDIRVARRRAEDLVNQLMAGRFEILEQTTARPAWATIGDCLEEYRKGVRLRGVDENTHRNYVSSLRSVLRASGYDSIEGLSLVRLDRGVVEQYAASKLNGVASDSDLERRARRTITSTLRQARALWGKWAMDRYRAAGLKIPDLTDWMKAQPVKPAPKVYRLPPQDLIDRTLAAAALLEEKRPDLAAAFICSYDLALRAGESAALRWDWFRRDAKDGRLMLDIIQRDGWSPKGGERTITVGEGTWAKLQELGASDRDHVLRPTSYRRRHDLVIRDLAAWMREVGWDRESYPKGAHELRKLMGSRWFTELGPAVAQAWLGHKDVSTTCRYYAALTAQPAALDRHLEPTDRTDALTVLG